MESNWYVVKVLPGKERILKDDFNKQILQGKINNIERFVCPTERELKVVKNKKVVREKVKKVNCKAMVGKLFSLKNPWKTILLCLKIFTTFIY